MEAYRIAANMATDDAMMFAGRWTEEQPGLLKMIRSILEEDNVLSVVTI